jgi:peptidoglycan/xylan/chitin deacetylase (PgdA/CDA1 family)
VVKSGQPLISFTFDDFPSSALSIGGSILKSHGASGTYYASLGLLGRVTETGVMFREKDLHCLIEQGHELGCHTYGHCHAWNTPWAVFEESIRKNLNALQRLFPGASLPTLSYPISVPRAGNKEAASKHFACCRSGGQTFNVGETDLNCLSAYFVEQGRDHPEQIFRMIEQTCRRGGWLIFATHDVAERPTPWGCTPELFEEVVRSSISSGACILPVFQAYETLMRRP